LLFRELSRSAESRTGAYGRRSVFELSGSGGFEDPRSVEELWRGTNPREQRLVARGDPGQHERTHGGKNASKRNELTETDGLPFVAWGNREAGESS